MGHLRATVIERMALAKDIQSDQLLEAVAKKRDFLSDPQ